MAIGRGGSIKSLAPGFLGSTVSLQLPTNELLNGLVYVEA